MFVEDLRPLQKRTHQCGLIRNRCSALEKSIRCVKSNAVLLHSEVFLIVSPGLHLFLRLNSTANANAAKCVKMPQCANLDAPLLSFPGPDVTFCEVQTQVA